MEQQKSNQLAAVEQEQLPLSSRTNAIEAVEDDDDEIDLRELWQVILRRKGTIALITVIVFLISLTVTLMMTPIYRASTTLKIQPEGQQNLLDFDIQAQGGRTNDRDFYQTQYEILKSRSLARAAIDELQARGKLRFSEQKLAKPFFADMLDSFSEAISGKTPEEDSSPDENNANNEFAEEELDTTFEVDKEEALADITQSAKQERNFLNRLTVSPVKNSQIVRLSYDHSDPELAAEIANTFAEQFIQTNIDRRIQAANDVVADMEGDLSSTRSKFLEALQKVRDYERDNGLINTSDDGKSNQTSVSRNVAILEGQLADAVKQRIIAEGNFEQAQENGGATTVLTNPAIQELKKVLSRLEAEYQGELQASSAFNNTVVRNLRQQLAQLQSRYQAELASSSAFNNAVVRNLRQEYAKLQAQYQGELRSPSAYDNPVIRTLRQRLAQLQTQLQGEQQGSKAYDSPSVRSLRTTLARLQSEYQEKLQIYKPAYPTMVQLKQKINETQAQIKVEITDTKQNNLSNLKQQIAELQKQIQTETQSINTKNISNVKRRMDELKSQIDTEINTVRASTTNSLKQQIDELQSQIKVELGVINSATVGNLKRQINELQAQLEVEIQNVSNTVINDYESKYLAAAQVENDLLDKLTKTTAELIQVRDKTVEHERLIQQAETYRSTYKTLEKRVDEISVAGRVKINNIAVIDTASIPYVQYKPNMRLNLALGAVLGVFLGTVLAFLLEFLDDRIKTTEELERILNLPLLGTSMKNRLSNDQDQALLTAREPQSATAEAFRSLRTHLLFSTNTGAPHSLAITSSMPSEGKSSTCTNLAAAFAQAGQKVLLIDADLRRPTLHKRFKISNDAGLAHYLIHQVEAHEAIQSSPIEGVYAMTAGATPLNPSELLSGERFKSLLELAPEQFNIIIVDCPPVMGLADALVLANHASATILIAAHAQSHKRALIDAQKRLHQAHANLIGTIMTKMKMGAGYGGYGGYNNQYYEYKPTAQKALEG